MPRIGLNKGGRVGNRFLFFQEEDGIRDYKVTGVQTCALPICIEACEIELCSGVTLDNAHGFSAARTVPGCAIRQWRKRQRFAALCSEQCSCQWQKLFTEAIRQQAVAADAHETFGQYVQEEAAEEVHRVQSHDALLAAVGIIAPAEADALPVESGDAVVGDGHAVGVAAEVAQDMFGAAEGRLGVDVPVLVAKLLDQLIKQRRITERSGRTSEVEQALAVEMVKACEELVAEDGAQNGNRQQEHRMSGVDPALMVG